MDLGNRIKTLRLSKGLTQDELANLLGLKKAAIHKYENGLVENIKRSTIQAMANIFEVSPCYILGWESSISEPPINNIQLSNEEKKLLSNFNKLNDLGKNEANKRVAELTEIGKYITDNELSATKVVKFPKDQTYTFAAHDDGLDEETAKRNITKAKAIFEEMDKED